MAENSKSDDAEGRCRSVRHSPVSAQLAEIARQYRTLPVLDGRDAEEILGYDGADRH